MTFKKAFVALVLVSSTTFTTSRYIAPLELDVVDFEGEYFEDNYFENKLNSRGAENYESGGPKEWIADLNEMEDSSSSLELNSVTDSSQECGNATCRCECVYRGSHIWQSCSTSNGDIVFLKSIGVERNARSKLQLDACCNPSSRQDPGRVLCNETNGKLEVCQNDGTWLSVSRLPKCSASKNLNTDCELRYKKTLHAIAMNQTVCFIQGLEALGNLFSGTKDCRRCGKDRQWSSLLSSSDWQR